MRNDDQIDNLMDHWAEEDQKKKPPHPIPPLPPCKTSPTISSVDNLPANPEKPTGQRTSVDAKHSAWRRSVIRFFRRSPAAPAIGFVILILWWLVGIASDNDTHWLALALALCCLCEAICRKWLKRWWWRAVCLLPVVGITFVFVSCASYESVWTLVEHEWPEKDQRLTGNHGWDADLRKFDRTVYHDLRWRWDDTIYWRKIDGHAKGSILPNWDSKGPMTATNRPHSHWVVRFGLGLSDKPESFRVEQKWYWFGDEISEGEWYLRAEK